MDSKYSTHIYTHTDSLTHTHTHSHTLGQAASIWIYVNSMAPKMTFFHAAEALTCVSVSVCVCQCVCVCL